MDGISVIVPSRDEGAGLRDMLERLIVRRSGTLPVQVVVVDDASSDGSAEALHAWSGQRFDVRVEVLRLSQWQGIPFARNRGAERARLGWLVHTDANADFEPAWDLHVAHAMRSHALACGAVRDLASRFVGYGCLPVLPSLGVRWLSTPDACGGWVPVASSAATAIHTTAFFELGGYDESLPFYGAAEVEFSWRAWLSGRRIALAAGWILGHRFRPPVERRRRLDPIDAIVRGNYLRLAACYLPDALLQQTLDWYAQRSPETRRAFDRELAYGHVWRRRQAIRQRLPLSFADYARAFGLLPMHAT